MALAFSLTLLLALSVCFAVAPDYLVGTHHGSLQAVFTRFFFFFVVLLLAGLFLLLWIACARVAKAGAPDVLRPLMSRFGMFSGLRATVLLGLLVTACWLPYLALLYPGNLSNDTTGQLAMFSSLVAGDGLYPMLEHHPVFDTLVYGAIVYPFQAVGHFRVGVALCVLLQSNATALAFAFCVVAAHRRWGAGTGVVCTCVALVSLLPLYPLLTFGLSKDSFFSWVFLVFLTYLADFVLTEDPLMRRMPHAVLFICSCALLVLTKKFGFYVALASLVAFLLGGGGPNAVLNWCARWRSFSWPASRSCPGSPWPRMPWRDTSPRRCRYRLCRLL